MTIQFHAKLYALRRTPKGFIVQLEIDATDQWQGVATADLGTQFGVAMVPVDRETGQPIPGALQTSPGPNTEEYNASVVAKSGIHPLVQKAGILAKSEDFAAWAMSGWPTSQIATERDVVQFIRSECGIQSRKELATNPEAAKRFEALVQRYYTETR